MKEMLSTIAAIELKRMEYSLSKGKWAKLLGMHPTNYSEFINGKRALPKEAMAVAYEFGVDPAHLFQRRPYKGARDIEAALSAQGVAK